MRLSLSLVFEVSKDQDSNEEPQPQGAEAFIERSNQDPRPRTIGFASPSEED